MILKKMKVKPQVYIETLQDFDETFTIILTNNTVIIYVDGEGVGKIYSNNHIPFGQLHFIKKVKDYANSININFGNVTSSDISYFQYSKKMKSGKYNNVVELDVNKAYWKIALQLEIISEEIYHKGLEKDKMIRLVSLGALATCKKKIHFDSTTSKFSMGEEIKNEKTRNYFFTISKTLDDLMIKCFDEIGRDNVFFYWVDAFFINKDYSKEVIDFFKCYDLEMKTKEIKTMWFDNTSEHKTALVWEDKIGKISECEKYSKLPIKEFTFESGVISKLKNELDAYIREDLEEHG